MFIDGGMTDNIRPALYQAEYEAVIANKLDEIEDEISNSQENVIMEISNNKIKLGKAEKGSLLVSRNNRGIWVLNVTNYNSSCICKK